MDLIFKLHVTIFDEWTEIKVLGTEKGLNDQITAVEEFLQEMKDSRPLLAALGDGDGRNE